MLQDALKSVTRLRDGGEVIKVAWLTYKNFPLCSLILSELGKAWMGTHSNIAAYKPFQLALCEMSSAFLFQPYQSCRRFPHPRPVIAYYPLLPSVPFAYAMATLTHTAVEKKKGPARPSNAWILYRKHKSQTLPPPPPGAPRRPQADASKIIASMWRSEPLHIRAEWERRAEEEKAKHKMIYPDYKFNPESKEKKEARKALKAQQKEIARANKRGRGRTQPYVIPVPAMPPSGPSHTSHVDPVAYYGECGPSPHLSAAPSPVSGGSSIIPLPPSQQYPQLYPPHSPSESSSGSDAYQNVQNREVHSSTSLDMYGNPMPPNQSPMPLLPAQQQVYAQPHLPQPIDYQSQQHNQPQQDTYQGEIPPWTHTPSNDGQVTLPGLSAEVSSRVYAALLLCLIYFSRTSRHISRWPTGHQPT